MIQWSMQASIHIFYYSILYFLFVYLKIIQILEIPKNTLFLHRFINCVLQKLYKLIILITLWSSGLVSLTFGLQHVKTIFDTATIVDRVTSIVNRVSDREASTPLFKGLARCKTRRQGYHGGGTTNLRGANLSGTAINAAKMSLDVRGY